MAKLNTLILGLQNKIRGDRVLAGLLASIATGKATSADISNFTRLVTQIFYLSEVTGYRWQSEMVSNRITNEGVAALVAQARTKGVTIADSLTDTLGNNPMLAQMVRESVLGQTVVFEGVGLGQLQTAEEAGLTKKRWVHTGASKEARPHHEEMDGVEVGKDEYFELSDGARVFAPHSWADAGPEQWAFCSCQAIYGN